MEKQMAKAVKKKQPLKIAKEEKDVKGRKPTKARKGTESIEAQVSEKAPVIAATETETHAQDGEKTVAAPAAKASEDTEIDVSALYFRDISEYKILTASEEKAAFEEMETILREAWSHILEVPQIHGEFANVIKDVLKANLGRIHEAARTYAAREGDPEVQKILRAKSAGMYTHRKRFSNTLMRIDPDLIILDGVALNYSRFAKQVLRPKSEEDMSEEEKLYSQKYIVLDHLAAKPLNALREKLKVIRKFRRLITNKRNAFLAANLKLVISVAKKYRGHSLTFDDMIQEGNMGLMTAIGRFDHRLGYKFSTYATWWIRQSITRALSVKDRTIRLPVHLHEIYYRVRRVTADLKEKLSRNPTAEEVAKAASLRPDQIKDYSHLFVEPESLDAGFDPSDDRTLGEFIPDTELVPSDEVTEHSRLSGEIKDLLKTLTPREEDILRRRFGIGQGRDYTLQEIAERYHLTRERIRQIEAKGLEKLRRPNRKRKLEEYCEEFFS